MKRVSIPFFDSFEKDMIAGRKVCTSRTRIFGQPGDQFIAFGFVFEIKRVEKMLLSNVAQFYHQQEGFDTPEQFQDCWKKIHPVAGFRPNQYVYLHTFERKSYAAEIEELEV